MSDPSVPWKEQNPTAGTPAPCWETNGIKGPDTWGWRWGDPVMVYPTLDGWAMPWLAWRPAVQYFL